MPGMIEATKTPRQPHTAPIVANDPIANTYPLEQVRDAYRELEQRHTLGRIVLHP